MEILDLEGRIAEEMIGVFGLNIFKYRDYSAKDTTTVRLNDNVILKCHGFDGSVRIELGAKMFILEKNDYWRITIE